MSKYRYRNNLFFTTGCILEHTLFTYIVFMVGRGLIPRKYLYIIFIVYNIQSKNY